MPELTCPICGRRFAYSSIREQPHFPFCSRRCQLIDLDNWLEGRYRIVDPVAAESEEDSRRREESAEATDAPRGAG